MAIYRFPGSERTLEIDADGVWYISGDNGKVEVRPGNGQVVVHPGNGQVILAAGDGQVIVKSGTGQLIIDGRVYSRHDS